MIISEPAVFPPVYLSYDLNQGEIILYDKQKNTIHI